MHRTTTAALILSSALLAAETASADQVYVALGDSITFGETNLQYVKSYGDRGYVGLFADALAAREGGVRPDVVNLAIDGETTSSFMTGSGRVPPVMGRGDVPLADENLNYNPTALVAQNDKFLATVASEKALGNTISTVSITLGFNDLATQVGATPASISAELTAYTSAYNTILSEIHQKLPGASLYVLGYYNPFPADPKSPAAPLFDMYGTQLNGIIHSLAAQNGGIYVDTAPPFVGHEAQYTYLAAQPAGSSVSGPFGGILPDGNVHPNATGYASIAASVEAVPEPASVALLAAGGLALLFVARRRNGSHPDTSAD